VKGYIYVGGGAVTLGIGGSITWSPSSPTAGWNIGLQGSAGGAAQIGYGFGRGGSFFWELGLGGSYPSLIGASLTGYYILGPF